jgi:hypothetical protein
MMGTDDRSKSSEINGFRFFGLRNGAVLSIAEPFSGKWVPTDRFQKPILRQHPGVIRVVQHGAITKTMSVTDLRKDAAHRYSPAAVVAVSREAVMGEPMTISTSYVERQNLTVRMKTGALRALPMAFQSGWKTHLAAIALYVAHYNLCRPHEALKTAPAVALGITDRVWTVGDLLDAALATQPITPVTTAPDRRKGFRVIDGGRS